MPLLLHDAACCMQGRLALWMRWGLAGTRHAILRLLLCLLLRWGMLEGAGHAANGARAADRNRRLLRCVVTLQLNSQLLKLQGCDLTLRGA